MHRSEIISCQSIIIFQCSIIQIIHHIKSNLVTTFSSTQYHRTRILISRRTNQRDDTRYIRLDEILTSNLIISIKPQIFHDDSQLSRLCRICRHQIVLHITLYLLPFILEIHIIWISIVLQQPLVQVVTSRRISREDSSSIRIII